MKLSENVRLRNAENHTEACEYDEWLLEVGNGNAPNAHSVHLPEEKTEIVVSEERHSGIMSAIFWVYENSLEVRH